MFRTLARRVTRIVIGSVPILGSFPSAPGQVCEPLWSNRFPGSPLNGSVYALYSHDDDGTGPNPPVLYVGGRFSEAGARTVNRVAQWDGQSWKSLGSGVDREVWALVGFDEDGPGPAPAAIMCGGFFRHAGDLGADYVAKWDGTSWSPLGVGTNGPVTALAVFDEDGSGSKPAMLIAAGWFTLAGGAEANRIAKWDGHSWAPLGEGTNDDIFALTVFDEDGDAPRPPALFAGGLFTIAGGSPANRVAKWDGASWAPLGMGTNGNVRALAAYDGDGAGPQAESLYVAGAFTSAGGKGANRIAIWDGESWSRLSVGGTDDDVNVMSVFDEDQEGPSPPVLYVAGEFSQAGGSTARGVAKWNGSIWQPAGRGLDDEVFALAPFDDDGPGPNPPALYAGGSFQESNLGYSNYIAQFDGDAWFGVDSVITGPVSGFGVIDDDGAGPSSSALYVVGGFNTIEGVRARRIARWDGTSWSSLGDGLHAGAFSRDALVVAGFDEDGEGPKAPALIAGGYFTRAGDATVNGIARWNGAAWSDLDGGVRGGASNGAVARVSALTVFDDDGDGPNPPELVVGGHFATAGSVDARGIAKWNGTVWSPLGNGVEIAARIDGVNALAVFDEDGEGPLLPALFVGGGFNMLDGLPSNFVRWDGSNWSCVEGDIGNPPAILDRVLALAVYDVDGPGPSRTALYVAGRFSFAAGVEANSIARWDGTQWTSVGEGVACTNGQSCFQEVSALAVGTDGGPHGHSLFVGGAFNQAGDIRMERIARWDGLTWSRLDTGMGGMETFRVQALAMVDLDGRGPNAPALFAGGTFTSAGGHPSQFIGQWSRPNLTGDVDRDGFTTLLDIAIFLQCMLGPDIPLYGGCCRIDLDYDGNGSLSDFAAFQNLLNGVP